MSEEGLPATGFNARWADFLNQLGRLTTEIWERSRIGTFRSNDPSAFSTQLFKRFRDHRNAFALLWNDKLAVDSETAPSHVRTSRGAGVGVATWVGVEAGLAEAQL